MLLIHTNTHHTHLQSYTHQSSRSGAGHKRAVLSVGCVVRQRGCRPPRSEAAADHAAAALATTIALAVTHPPTPRTQRKDQRSDVYCRACGQHVRCDERASAAEQSRTR